MNVIGPVGWMSKRKYCRIDPKWPMGLIAKGTRIMFWLRNVPNDSVANCGDTL